MQDLATHAAAKRTFEEIVLESIVFNPTLPEQTRLSVAERLGEMQEARMPWLTHPNECTCDDCAAIDAVRAA